MTIKVKVCGVTSRDDALRAVDLGADAIGFVFVPSSPRRAHPAEVERAVADLPAFVTAVGVFRDQDAAFVRATAEACGIGVAQLHGHEGMDYIAGLRPLRVLKAILVTTRDDLSQLASYPTLAAFLVDGSPHDGTTDSRAYDWSWAAEARRYGRVVLAGGLSPENVVQAIRQGRPWAVDVSSGVEVRPGVKDPERMRLFIQRAKEGESDG